MKHRLLQSIASSSAIIACVYVAATTAINAQPPTGGRGGMPGMNEERKLVKQFDKNADGRLDQAERDAARAWMASQPQQGFGGPGGRMGGGGRGATPIVPGEPLSPSAVTAVGKAAIYDAAAYRTFFLTFDNAAWESELESFNNTDVDVPAQVTVDGKRYRDVGVHFRGNSSYFMVPTGKKRSLNLSFDFAVDSQEIGGYRSFNFLNAANDPTFVRTLLYSHVANKYLPAPKTNFVRVVINGENWGAYVSAQQFNKDFLRDFYGSIGGARWHVPGSPFARAGLEYLGDSVAPYRAKYVIKTKDTPARWNSLIALTRTLNQTPVDKLEAALAPMLDIDETLRFLAVDVALVNSDGYWTRASDYNIYQDTTGKFHILPHDMNEGLGTEEGGPGGGGGGRGGPGGQGRGGPPGGGPPNGGPPNGGPPNGGPPGGFPGGPPGMGGRGGPMMMAGGPDLDPLVGLDNVSTPLRAKLLAVPSLRAKYLGYVRQIAERDLNWETLAPVVSQYQRLIAEDVARDTRKLYSTESFTSSVDVLKTFITKRRAYLLEKIPAR